MTVTSISGDTTNTTLRLSNSNALTSGTVTVNPGAAAAGGNGNQVDLAGVTIGSGVGLVLDTLGTARSSLLGGVEAFASDAVTAALRDAGVDVRLRAGAKSCCA